MNALHNADCFEVMAAMPDNSVDAIITDPPYGITELFFDKQPIDFELWMKECQRILKPSGVLVSFADFNLLAKLRGLSPFKSTYELIWQKTMAVGFLNAGLRPLMGHEFIGVFVDGLKASTYNPQKTKGKAYKRTPIHNQQQLKKRHSTQIYAKCFVVGKHNTTGDRHPTTIIKAANGNYKTPHPTAKPIDLCEWLIKTYSNEGDIILDPFMGGGSTGIAAKNLNRRFIGIEKHKPYFDIAEARINGSA